MIPEGVGDDGFQKIGGHKLCAFNGRRKESLFCFFFIKIRIQFGKENRGIFLSAQAGKRKKTESE